MRKDGVDQPRWKLRELASVLGALEVLDVRDEGVSRSIKIARHASGQGPTRRVDVLYEPHLVWMSEGRFTLAGFERVQSAAGVVNYAQSWLCTFFQGTS